MTAKSKEIFSWKVKRESYAFRLKSYASLWEIAISIVPLQNINDALVSPWKKLAVLLWEVFV